MNLSSWRKKYNVPSNKKLLDKAKTYTYNKDWYTESLQAIKDKYGTDTPLFIDLLAVTSPRTTVKRNLYLADKTLKYFKTNKSIDFSYGIAHKQINNNVDKLRQNKPYGGQKVNKFAQALKGDLDKVVIDSWMLKAFNIKRQAPTPNDIIHITDIITKLSKELNMYPAEFQACLWSYAKAELNDSPFKEDLSFKNYMEDSTKCTI